MMASANRLSHDMPESDERPVSAGLYFGLILAVLILCFSHIDRVIAATSGDETSEAKRPPMVERAAPAEVNPVRPSPAIQAAAPQTASEVLTPQMRATLEHVARRYRVSSEALVPIFRAVQSSGRERKLDPLLIVAVIGIESGFNPFSESAMGALGLMQVMPRFHLDKLPAGTEKWQFLDPATNIQVGAHILQESIHRHGGLIPGLQQFAGALNDEAQAYANKVLAEKERLEQAARSSGLRGV